MTIVGHWCFISHHPDGRARIGIPKTVEMDEVLVGLGDVDENSGQKLEWVEQGIVVELVPGFWVRRRGARNPDRSAAETG